MSTKRVSFLILIIEEEIILLILKTPKSTWKTSKFTDPTMTMNTTSSFPTLFDVFRFHCDDLLSHFSSSQASVHIKRRPLTQVDVPSIKQQQDSTRQSYTRFLSVYINANIKHEHKRHKNKFYQLKGEEFFSPPSLFVVFVVVFVFMRCLQWSSW